MNLSRHGMSSAETCLPALDEGQVRLGLGEVVQVDRVLRRKGKMLPRRQHSEVVIQKSDAKGVTVADRTHAVDLSLDELHPILRLQDPGLRHRVILVAREQPLEGL